MRRNIDAGHRFHETGSETAKAAIAKRRIGFERSYNVEIDIQRRQRRAHILHQAEIGESVAHHAPDQKFERQVIDALFLVLIGFLGRLDPVINDTVAHHHDGRGQPVMRRSDGGVLADPVFERLQHLGGERLRVGISQIGLSYCRHARHVVSRCLAATAILADQ
jgi:hypothetical protein